MTVDRERRGARIVFVALGGPLTAFLIVVGALSITGTLARQSESDPLAFDQTIRRIQIDLDHGSVTLRGGDQTTVTGERLLTRGLQSPSFTERVDGTTLVIEASCFPVGNTWCDVSYVLDVPRSVTASAGTAIGAVRASGLDGDLELRSATGSITVEGASGDLVLESGAGSVRGQDLRARSVRAASGAGSVDLQFLAPPHRVDARAGAGSVDVELPRDATGYRIDQTDEGRGQFRIAVNTDVGSDNVLLLQSGAGSVTVHYPEA